MMGLFNVDPQNPGLDIVDLFQTMSGLFQLVYQSLSVGLEAVLMLSTPAQRKAAALREKIHDILRGIIKSSDDTLEGAHPRTKEELPTVFSQLSEFDFFLRAFVSMWLNIIFFARQDLPARTMKRSFGNQRWSWQVQSTRRQQPFHGLCWN